MRHASGHNYRNSLFVVDMAMGQIPCSTEHISSCVRELVCVIFRCNCCLCVRSKQYGRFMCRWAEFPQALDEIECVFGQSYRQLQTSHRRRILYIRHEWFLLRGHKEVFRPIRWNRGEANSSGNCTTSSRMEPDTEARGRNQQPCSGHGAPVLPPG